MADPYIDQSETQIYGLFAREQMAAVCLGKIPALDGMVQFAIQTQAEADAAMKLVLDQQPQVVVMDSAVILEDARDLITRFGSYIGSLKGHPLDPKDYFGSEQPSVVARRRIVKLVDAMKRIHDRLTIDQAKAAGSAEWLADIAEVHQKLSALEKNQRAAKVEKIDVAPDVAAERLRWLAVYNANKLLIEGLLLHLGKLELMPLIFDDLAETHRVKGVSDKDAPPAPPAPAPKPEPAKPADKPADNPA